MSLNSEVLAGSGDKSSSSSGINVGGAERFACAIAGGALAAYGLRRRSAGGLVLTLAGAALLHRGGTGHCNTYQALGITTAHPSDHNASEDDRGVARDVHVEKSIIIDKSPEELYSFWRDFENLPRFMDHLESVNSVGLIAGIGWPKDRLARGRNGMLKSTMKSRMSLLPGGHWMVPSLTQVQFALNRSRA